MVHFFVATELATWAVNLSAVRDVVVAAAAVTTATVAIRGLNKWRAELRGKADYELARRVLTCVYRVRESIKGFRVSGLIWGDEAEDRPGRNSERPQPELDEAWVYQKRLNRVYQVRAALCVELLEAEAAWGPVLESAYVSLAECIRKLHVNTLRHVRSLNRASGGATTEQFDAIHAVIDLQSDDESEDAYTLEVNDAVRAFEAVLKRHLGRI